MFDAKGVFIDDPGLARQLNSPSLREIFDGLSDERKAFVLGEYQKVFGSDTIKFNNDEEVGVEPKVPEKRRPSLIEKPPSEKGPT